MEQPKSDSAQMDTSAQTIRLENQPNPLLERVKAQVSEQMKARVEKGEGLQARTAVCRQVAR